MTEALSVNRRGDVWWRRRRRLFWHAVILVLLTLPHGSDEFNFGFGGDDEGNEASSGAAGNSKSAPQPGGERNLAKRRATDKKFKFHKIERVYVDDYVMDENEEDDNDDNGDAAIREASESPDEDARSRSINEAEEYQIERKHRAQKERRRAEASAGPEGTSRESRESKSMLMGFIAGLFGYGKDEKKSRNTYVEPEKSNNIIDWLKWLSERLGRLPTKAPPIEKPASITSFNWLDYLNRWPFNSIFPIGQPAKPIRMPRRGQQSDNDRQRAYSVEQPMSQEHFESLLHTLPGFVANVTHVEELECRQQLQVFHRQLRAHKLWTLQMLDATGKITAGILRGNINQFGDFERCTQVRTLIKVTPERPMRIRGKYCLAHIEAQTDAGGLKVPVHLAHGRGLWNGHLGNPNHFVPRYTVANWGVCIPHACSAAVVRELLETNLRPYNLTGVEFHVEVQDTDCSVRQSRRFLKLLQNDSKFTATILYITGLLLLGLCALFREHWTWLRNLVQSLRQRGSESSNPQDEATEQTEATVTEVQEATAEADPEGTEETEVIEETEMIEETEVLEETTAVEPDVNTSIKLLALELLDSFSPQRTLHALISRDSFDVDFPVLHLLKLAATFMLYICLKFLMIGHLPLSNRDSLVSGLEQPFSVLFRAPLIYSDTLLLLSGFLAAHQLSEEMEQRSYIQLLKRVASKTTRYLPALYVVLCFQTWILPHLDAGPLWSNLVGENARLCERQMWRSAFNVQNAIDIEETCSPLTIQLALNVQLYLLGPFIVWLYFTDADAAFFTCGALHALSVAARYSRTSREHLSLTLFHGMNVSKFYRTANMIYASPLSRATPYLLGIGAGLFYRSEQSAQSLTGPYLPIGWVLAAVSVVWCFWSPAAGMRTDFIYTVGDAAAYAAWSPLILGLALCWCILFFPRGKNTALHFLSGSRPVLLLSRIAYPLQLAMYVVVIWNTASVNDTLKYQLTDLINFQEIGSILCLGLILAVLIDVPAQRVRHLLINRIFMERPQQDHEPVSASGAEPSEGEQSEVASEPVTSETPEPPETIWASDPEEEELKYIARRRSSIAGGDIAEVAESNASEASQLADQELVVKAEDEEEEEEEDTEIEEEAEVKKRPETPPKKEPTPAPPPTRRRRAVSDD